MLSIRASIRASIRGSVRSDGAGNPSLLLDFANEAYGFASPGEMLTPVPYASLITLTRASGGGITNAAGVLEWVGNDVPRITYDPVTLKRLGQLIEEQRTNLVLNSAVLATQNVTVTAVAHTLSFYGTGTVTLSGVATGSKVGSGAYPARSELTFTPTAGVLTLTVTGSVTFGQLEAGSSSSSYIPTTTAQVTRAADVASVNTLSPWYNALEGTIVVSAATANNSYATVAQLTNGTINNEIRIVGWNDGSNRITVVHDGVGVTPTMNGQPSWMPRTGAPFKVAAAYKMGVEFSYSGSGGVPVSRLSALSPAGINQLRLGSTVGNLFFLNGIIASITYYPRVIDVQQASA